jgi:site-specific DNA-methyltransferase (adenine-specific)
VKLTIGNSSLYLGDCIEIMRELETGSVDMVLCDLPFGTTYAEWDKTISMRSLWDAWARIVKGNGAIVLHASQPFTSALVSSNPGMFRCEWIWNKENAANFANANKQPLKQHESVLVFGKGQTPYYPIKTQGAANHKQGNAMKSAQREGFLISNRAKDDQSGLKHPKTILNFPRHSSQCKFHPNEKPVPLLEYLVKTYTLENDTVLDSTMGSGSTGVACVNTGRNFVGIEQDPTYFGTAKMRVENAGRLL